MPTFWFSMILIYTFGFVLNWLPIMGMHTVGDNSSGISYATWFFRM